MDVPIAKLVMCVTVVSERSKTRSHFLFYFLSSIFMKQTLLSKCQIVGKDLVNFCGLLRKHELYPPAFSRDYYETFLLEIFSKIEEISREIS